MYSRDLIDAILAQADIVTVISSYITVTKKGRSYVALCPFHDDKNPSLNISKEKQIFKCFVCGTGGNAITFVEKFEKISFEEAVRKVADLIGFHDERLEREAYHPYVDPALTPLYACINDLAKYYQYSLTTNEGKEAADYLASRHIAPDQISKYGLGYAPLDGRKTVQFLQAKGHSLKSIEDIGIALAKLEGTSDSNAGRLIFPLADPDGQIVGFSARRLKDDASPKYVNSPETALFRKGKLIYNYHNAKISAHRNGYVYLLEGFMDVMALDKAGLSSAVALMGTMLTQDQIELLRRLNCEIRLCLDGDAAGQEGMMRMTSLLNKAGLPFRLVSNPGDERDPDDILQEGGPPALKEAMGHLVDAFDFQVNYYSSVRKLSTPEERRKVMMYFIPFLRNVPAGIDRENYLVKLSRATGYEIAAIREEINKAEPESMTQEETAYIDEIETERLHPDLLLKKRLLNAEREALYYMLNKMEAVKYFEKSIESFYYPLYNEIANYVAEYVDKRNEPVELAKLISDIATSGADDSDQLIAKLSEIASDDYHPPYSAKGIADCHRAMLEEKEKVYEKTTTASALAGKSVEEKAAIVKEALSKRRRKLFEKTPNTEKNEN
jgi:DNA primase